MTWTLARPARLAAPSRRPTHHSSMARFCESTLDATVVVLATWTIVYHVCVVLRLDVPWAVSMETVALVGCGVVWRRAQRGSGDSPRGADVIGSATGRRARQLPGTLRQALLPTAIGFTAVTALLFAVNAGWPVIAAGWLVSAVAGTAWAFVGAVDPAATAVAPDQHSEEPTSAGIALLWAGALAVLSTFTLWPNPDDLYYVNLSQWVADHGTYPIRDTIFSDLVFPMSSWPPMASYDLLAGTLARLAGVQAASVVYYFVPPLATFLSVLALWRLLRAWRVRAVGVALSLALVFLLLDGGSGYAAPGNLFLIRIWQGKVILLCLLVPILLVYALRYVEHPTKTNAGWLFAGGVAAVGLSTTAMFIVPLLAAAGAAPLCVRRPAKALLGFTAMAAYPIAAGVLTVAVDGHSADLFGSRALFRFDPAWFGHQIFRDGPVALIAVAAVLAGAYLVPHPQARVTTGLLTLITGITFVPGFTHLSYDVVGLGPTLWRVSWVASIAALVGVLGAYLAVSRPSRTFSWGVPTAFVVALVLFGLPIWSERNGVNLKAPFHWQRGSHSVASAERAIAAARPGDVILSSQDLAITIDVLTTRVKTVAPRDYFMDYLKDDPAFHYTARLTLVDFANEVMGRADPAKVARALTLLDVDEVCLPVASRERIHFIEAQGYRPVASSPYDRCMTR